ncbi:hypothetical protein AKJ09_03187 [Labilithrix luteola]|uniref:Uncharacterized protein n=1 Tax=Labilithrix luteola TaxID=1391654 RepID=A0A0K1PSL0_9BACT|nr:hypothetical protein AKJ09_03187 [Labilithrix luteola]
MRLSDAASAILRAWCLHVSCFVAFAFTFLHMSHVDENPDR